MRSFFLGVLLLLAGATTPMARAQEPLVLSRLSGPITLDGLSDEAAWRHVAPLPGFVQFEPHAGAAPTERTDVLVAYDDAYLYVAARLFDRDPGAIQSYTLQRDSLSSDDEFAILLDTFDDNENGVLFSTTPAGTRRDVLISQDLASVADFVLDYNTFWDVATAVTAWGWSVEMRIPFSSLRFQQDGGRVRMALIVQRLIPRKQERHVFPAVSPEVSRWAFLKPSQAHAVVIEDVESRPQVLFSPYTLGGIGSAAVLDDARTGFDRAVDVTRDLGFDVKYGLTSDLTLDVTANTDFAQVEADDQQLNLSRFSLFLPEKRAFFQERSGIFEFGTGGSSRVFHSRRIGLTDDGTPVRILGGARVAGRIGRWDVGLLEMQTAEEGDVPSENFGVVRLRRQVLNPYSYAGGIVTSRIDMEGRYNLAYGLDGTFRVRGDDYLFVSGSHTVERGQGYRLADAGRLYLYWNRRSIRGLLYSAGAGWSGADYDPGAGFVERGDVAAVHGQIGYGWLPAASTLYLHSLRLYSIAFFRSSDGTLETLEVNPAWAFTARSGATGQVEVRLQHEALAAPFALPENVSIPVGRYTFVDANASYAMPENRTLRASVAFGGGAFYDGRRAYACRGPRLFPTRGHEYSPPQGHEYSPAGAMSIPQ